MRLVQRYKVDGEESVRVGTPLDRHVARARRAQN